MQIACHLFLVVAFPDAQEQNHWRKELRNYFTEVNRWWKRSSVSIPESAVLKLLYEEPLGTDRDKLITMDDAIDHMKDFVSNPQPNRSAVGSTDFRVLIQKLLNNPRYLQDNPGQFSRAYLSEKNEMIKNLRINYYADGPFTRIEFVIHCGETLIAVPKVHAVGEKGDLVPTLSPHTAPCRYYLKGWEC